MPRGNRLLAAFAVTPVVADLLSTIAAPSSFWSQFLPTLYYTAIVIAGLEFGWKIGLSLAAFSGVCHALIAYFLQASSLVRLEAQLLAFLVVGFAFVEERKRVAERLGEVHKGSEELTSPLIDSRLCLEQVSAVASELIHQVRTPLASIEGAAFILEEDGPQLSNPGEFVQIIRRECSRMNDTLSDIGASTEALPLNCEPIDIASMLGEAVRLSALEVPDPTIALRTEVASNLSPAWCDKEEILHVIVPFVTSAMNSMPGGGEIMLAADRQEGQLRIQLKILGQTVRASDPAAGRGPFSSTFDAGAGLRLLAARRTMIQHGGTIRVEQAGQIQRLLSVTIPLYNGQRP